MLLAFSQEPNFIFRRDVSEKAAPVLVRVVLGGEPEDIPLRLGHELREGLANFAATDQLRRHKSHKSQLSLAVEREVAIAQGGQGRGGRVVNVGGECLLDAEVRLAVASNHGVPVSLLEYVADVPQATFSGRPIEHANLPGLSGPCRETPLVELGDEVLSTRLRHWDSGWQLKRVCQGCLASTIKDQGAYFVPTAVPTAIKRSRFAGRL